MSLKNVAVEVGFGVFVAEGVEPVGAVRAVHPHDLLVYIENAGEYTIGSEAVVRVHDDKVVIDPARLTSHLQQAIEHAHDGEDPRL